jgi:hypothetical protein
MGRQAQTNHGSGIERLAKLARIAGLDYHVIRYEEGRGMPPAILDSSAFDDPDEAATDAWRAKAKRMDESTPGWRALRHPNGRPTFSLDGTMLDDHGNRSVFDDVDE